MVKKRPALKSRVKMALDAVMNLRLSLKRDQAGDTWKHRESLQAFRDCLECFKKTGVILDYNLETGEITYE